MPGVTLWPYPAGIPGHMTIVNTNAITGPGRGGAPVGGWASHVCSAGSGHRAGCTAGRSRRLTGPPTPHPAPAVPGLVEQLTARERENLALLAAGTPDPRIADELVITLDTVKKHVSHLLGKLGAANRTEAVTRARQVG